jgi:hypothetical protein
MATSDFHAKDFTPTKFNTGLDKAAFCSQFCKFVESDFKETLFTKKFYTRLSMTFGHIAHYNREGFYDTWFSNEKQRLEFIQHTLHFHPFGDPAYTYCDAEGAIQEWLVDEQILYRVQIAHENIVETYERAPLAALKVKYEHKETQNDIP